MIVQAGSLAGNLSSPLRRRLERLVRGPPVRTGRRACLFPLSSNPVGNTLSTILDSLAAMVDKTKTTICTTLHFLNNASID